MVRLRRKVLLSSGNDFILAPFHLVRMQSALCRQMFASAAARATSPVAATSGAQPDSLQSPNEALQPDVAELQSTCNFLQAAADQRPGCEVRGRRHQRDALAAPPAHVAEQQNRVIMPAKLFLCAHRLCSG